MSKAFSSAGDCPPGLGSLVGRLRRLRGQMPCGSHALPPREMCFEQGCAFAPHLRRGLGEGQKPVCSELCCKSLGGKWTE